jgi:small subunit ribosomal protein S7
MSRRRRATKRKTEPDPRYQSVKLAKFINKVMKDGKKSIAQRIVYDALDIIAEKTKLNPLEVFEGAVNNSMPLLEVKTRRIGGANYQVPVEIPASRREAMAMGWIIDYSRDKNLHTMEDALSAELTDCHNNNYQCGTIKKKEDTHKQAEANKAFAHFKW